MPRRGGLSSCLDQATEAALLRPVLILRPITLSRLGVSSSFLFSFYPLSFLCSTSFLSSFSYFSSTFVCLFVFSTVSRGKDSHTFGPLMAFERPVTPCCSYPRTCPLLQRWLPPRAVKGGIMCRGQDRIQLENLDYYL